MHFRQDPLITRHFEETEGKFTHTYKGKEYAITPDTVGLLDEKTIQSVSTRLRKLYPPKPKPVKGQDGARFVQQLNNLYSEVLQLEASRNAVEQTPNSCSVEWINGPIVTNHGTTAIQIDWIRDGVQLQSSECYPGMNVTMQPITETDERLFNNLFNETHVSYQNNIKRYLFCSTLFILYTIIGYMYYYFIY
jgi:hypothetical protein